jgi:purine-binding chemotaxis protein CheW
LEASTQTQRFLTFWVDEQLYAIGADQVAEVIRLPEVAKVPQGPTALLGLANLRGSILPVAGLRELLGRKSAAAMSTARAIVLDIGAPVAVVVDSIATLETVNTSQIETRQSELGAGEGDRLTGAFATGSEKRVAKILDIKPILEAAFTSRARAKRQDRERGPAMTAARAQKTVASETLVTFDVAGQEFGLPLAAVEEILAAPASITAVSRAEQAVLGMTSVRETLMPLLSLRNLLGFAGERVASGREKVLVVKVHGAQVGLVADNARAIVNADLERIDPVPPILAARVGGESRIRAIYRGEGRRLVSILAPEQLFREDVMQRMASNQPARNAPAKTDGKAGEEFIVLVFRLGDDEFGLPIETVVEVAQAPTQVTRIPRGPKFLEGVVNLRGDVLPVIDQRRRFEMPRNEDAAARKLVVVKTERHRAGLIVDGVSDVLRTTTANVEPAPDLTNAVSRLVRGVINLPADGRIILLLEPTELLTRAEQGQLDAFHARENKADA